MDNIERLAECVTCEFFDICNNTIADSDLKGGINMACKGGKGGRKGK